MKNAVNESSELLDTANVAFEAQTKDAKFQQMIKYYEEKISGYEQ